LKTAGKLSQKEIESYRSSFRQRQERESAELQLRKERAWSLARQAGAMLKDRFGASRVVVFGSLVREGAFTLWSDIDLAVWGLSPDDTFRAIGAVYDLDEEISLNLVDINTARASLLNTIEIDGIEL
jgi:uncharacterized protein